MGKMNQKKSEISQDKRDWKNLMAVASLGINLVLTSIVGLLIGYYLDKWLSTGPVFLLIFFALGIFAGFRQFFLEIRRLDKDEK
jgi:ATP synthase protein I